VNTSGLQFNTGPASRPGFTLLHLGEIALKKITEECSNTGNRGNRTEFIPSRRFGQGQNVGRKEESQSSYQPARITHRLKIPRRLRRNASIVPMAMIIKAIAL
jgi:hypothetical protein